jgi:glycosyltransferase involved in cell wall biosynthesis
MSEEGWAKQLARFQEGSPFSSYDEKTGAGLERAEPTAAEFVEQHAAPGRDADHELGVLYRADHETLDDGICRQARSHACALAEHVPLVLRSINNRVRIRDPITRERIVVLGSDDALEPAVYRQVGALRKATLRRSAVCVNQTVISSAASLWRLLIPGYAQGAPDVVGSILAASIVYTPWERDRVGQELVEVLNKVGQVWLQCERNVDAFTRSGVEPGRIRLVPNAFDPDAVLYQLARTRKRPLRNHGSRAFYTIGKWEPRKQQHRLIGAFLRAFKPGDRRTLYVKSHEYRPWRGYPTMEESVAHWLADSEVRARGWTSESFSRQVFMDPRVVSDKAIAELHLQNDIYVSASHAEGWDYPAFDAVSVGNRLVHVGYGGSEDYAPEDSVLVPWHDGPVDPVYQWEEGSRWADYADEDLVGALERAETALPPPKVPVPAVHPYRESVIGAQMAAYVRALAIEVGQELP